MIVPMKYVVIAERSQSSGAWNLPNSSRLSSLSGLPTSKTIDSAAIGNATRVRTSAIRATTLYLTNSLASLKLRSLFLRG